VNFEYRECGRNSFEVRARGVRVDRDMWPAPWCALKVVLDDGRPEIHIDHSQYDVPTSSRADDDVTVCGEHVAHPAGALAEYLMP
jgi:hypothetical protein